MKRPPGVYADVATALVARKEAGKHAMATPQGVAVTEGFRALATAQLPRLHAIARKLAGGEAEDAVQDCLLKGFRSYDRLADRSAGPAWLVAILVNTCRDRARAKARRPPETDLDVEELESFSLFRKIADEDPFPYSDSLHLDFLAQFGADDVRQVLLGMPEIYRVPLVLVHMYGFPTREVAEMVDAPLGTVLARLHRGRKVFERRIWEYAEAHGLLEEARR